MRTLILGTSLRGLADAARISLEDGAEVVMYDAEVPDPPGDLAGRDKGSLHSYLIWRLKCLMFVGKLQMLKKK